MPITFSSNYYVLCAHLELLDTGSCSTQVDVLTPTRHYVTATVAPPWIHRSCDSCGQRRLIFISSRTDYTQHNVLFAHSQSRSARRNAFQFIVRFLSFCSFVYTPFAKILVVCSAWRYAFVNLPLRNSVRCANSYCYVVKGDVVSKYLPLMWILIMERCGEVVCGWTGSLGIQNEPGNLKSVIEARTMHFVEDHIHRGTMSGNLGDVFAYRTRDHCVVTRPRRRMRSGRHTAIPPFCALVLKRKKRGIVTHVSHWAWIFVVYGPTLRHHTTNAYDSWNMFNWSIVLGISRRPFA